MNLFGYTYKIYDIGYKLEMMSKECNAGDPLETPGGLYRGPPSNENTIFKNMCIQFKSVQCSFTMNVNQYSSSSRSVSSVLLVGFGLYDVLRRHTSRIQLKGPIYCTMLMLAIKHRHGDHSSLSSSGNLFFDVWHNLPFKKEGLLCCFLEWKRL